MQVTLSGGASQEKVSVKSIKELCQLFCRMSAKKFKLNSCYSNGRMDMVFIGLESDNSIKVTCNDSTRSASPSSSDC